MPSRFVAFKKPVRTKTGKQQKSGVVRAGGPTARVSAAGPAGVDERRTLALVMELMAIRGKSGQEGKVAETIIGKLRDAGAPAAQIVSDNAHRLTPLEGEVGNLIFKLPGTLRAPAPAAHGPHGHRADLRRRATGAQERLRSLGRQTDRPGRGRPGRRGGHLERGPDDSRAQAAAPAADVSVGRAGRSRALWRGTRELKLLGGPKLAFNWDGGPADKLTLGATGGYRLAIHIEGLASHAGGAPEAGVSAIAIAGLAIASLVRDGWHGLIRKGDRQGTSNIGVIRGGDATNVVTDRVDIRAEARSHDPDFRMEIVAAIRKAFDEAAQSVRNVAGRPGSVQFEGRLDYEAFKLAADEPCVLAAEAAVRAVGGEPLRFVSNGGLDANWMSALAAFLPSRWVADNWTSTRLPSGSISASSSAPAASACCWQRAHCHFCRFRERFGSGARRVRFADHCAHAAGCLVRTADPTGERTAGNATVGERRRGAGRGSIAWNSMTNCACVSTSRSGR